MDERNKNVALRVIAVMYFLTILALQGITIYRQLILQQDIHDFEDIAIVMLINTLFLLSALLYFGAIPLQKIKIKSILLFYGSIVILGSLFVFLKYNIFGEQPLTFAELLEKMGITAAVSGLIVLFFLVFSILGKRKLEKELAD